MTSVMIPVSDELKKMLSDPRNADTTKLAYLGDAVFEVYVRMKSCEECGRHSKDMNKASVHYVKADSQAEAARNRTNTSHPRGSTEKAYKLATGLEALFGWLYIKGDTERLSAAVAKAMQAVDESDK